MFEKITQENVLNVLEKQLDQEQYRKLEKISNPELLMFIAKYILWCKPEKIFVSDGSLEDVAYLRESSVRNREEITLAAPGHTVHFDGPQDQARDKAQTKFLLEEGDELPGTNTMDKKEGLSEIHEIMSGIMGGKELYVCLHCLGPTDSQFSLPAVQMTDSAYVAHSLNLLYRQGYGEFRRQADDSGCSNDRFLKIVHSAGELDENMASKNIDDRRVYIDREAGVVYSANTQYAGNTVGLKKLSMRLAMYLASEEGWLVEHMNLFGVKSKDGKITYFAGAFPSMCGKTATAMMSGFGDGEGNGGIVGDDIVHIKVVEGEDGVKRLAAVNVENGMFGIIKDVNAKDDPEIFNAIVDGEEVIVSNVLVASNGDYRWIGDERGEYPAGRNFQGEWSPEQAGKIPPSHKNARFTLPLKNLANLDANLDNPGGVPLGALVYGGRDSNTWVPVCQALNWHHGINTMAASLESETTAAALGKEGVRVSNPMANLDFLSVTMGRYISDNNNIVDGVDEPPAIFGVNYFLIGEDGQFLNGKNDKVVWYQWMALRINGEVDAIETPVGHIPKYEDLMPLFQEHLGQEYTKTQYDEQFKIRVPELIAKVDRGLAYFDDKGDDVPEILKKDLLSQKERLEKTLNS